MRDRVTPALDTLLAPAERIMLTVTAALAALGLGLIGLRGYAVDWPAYAPIYLVGSALIAAGLWYRRAGRSLEIAATLAATGSYVLFAAVASKFNYLLLPISRAPIDGMLAALDAHLGFHWPDALEAAARYPLVVEATRHAYLSSLVQFAIIVPLLGLRGRTRDLHLFMLATTLACLMTVGIWALAPSFGTSTVYQLPPEIMAAVRPVVGNGYGAELLRLAAEGPALISPRDTLGLIAAPSFHTVMALLAVHATRNLPAVRPVALAVNLLVLPGTIIHGGHHLVDVLAGAVVTVAAVLAARALLEPRRIVLPAAA